MKRMRNVNKKKARRRRFLLVFILLIAILIVGSMGYYFYSLRPVGNGSEKITFKIKEGQTYDEVLDDLEKDHMIKSATTAKLYARLNTNGQYYAGNFSINDGMSTGEILNYIGNINNSLKEQVTITIPEGTWAKEVAASIASKFNYSQEEILNQWNDIDYIKKLAKEYTFLDPDTLNNSNYKVKLEGYLFPDTYSFNSDASIDEITRTFLDRFQKMYDKYEKQIKKSDYSLQQILSLASVVQFESSSEKEMKKIAGVFYNRLDQNMMLQSSVTVCYALYDDFDDPKDCEVNTDTDSPYNTYLHEGLPIGPILNPGEKAIAATLNPTKSDYLYFVADINGDGKIYYSKTYEDHQAKMEELGLVMDGSTE